MLRILSGLTGFLVLDVTIDAVMVFGVTKWTGWMLSR